MTISIAQWLKQASKQFEFLDEPQRESQALLCAVAGLSSSYLYTWPDRVLEQAQLEALNAAIEKRLEGLPLAYIVGEKDFWSLSFKVQAGVLVPRPETELLLEHCLQHAQSQPKGRLLDLGTGSGAIALSFAKEKPDWQVVAVDYSETALAVAQENAERFGLTNVSFVRSDWFTAIEGRFDIIVSNPPYIDSNEPELEGDGVKHEPLEALVAPDKGLADIANIVDNAADYLNPKGLLAIEHGYQQGLAVQGLMQAAGFSAVQTHKDYAGQDRFTVSQLNS